MSNKKQQKGVCKICGKSKVLTFEHIPPRASFNKDKVESISGDELIKTIAGKRLPWDTKGLKKKISQNGTKLKSLCSSCNSFTGQHYASWYVELCGGFHNVLKSENPKLNETYEFELVKVKPLNIFKQIVSMFASTTSICSTHKVIKEFILELKNTDFPKDEFRILINLFGAGIPKITGPMAVATKRDMYLLSQIVAYPFELTMIMNYDKLNNKDLSIYGTDITSFIDYDFNEEANLKLKLKIIQSYSALPLERRGAQEIANIWNKSKKENE